MLKNLKISNYALIEKSDIDFSSGFSVITGETGAGKSIILGALGLLMGQRADSKVIKANEKKCAVEAVFNIEGLQLEAFFSEHDIDYDAEECILRREVSSNGKSRAFVNDSPVSASTLKLLAAEVIDIHSQHQNLLMGREHFLLDILDAVANNQEVKDAYAQCFHKWHEACKALKQIKEQYPETVFHGTDVGHTWESTGPRYLAYLEANGQKDTEEYKRTQENMEQGKRYYEIKATDEASSVRYREDWMVENFRRSYQELEAVRRTDIMGIYGSTHIVESEYRNSDFRMAKQLSENYGEHLHTKDLTQEPERIDTLEVNGKTYTASYFGEQDISMVKGYKTRKFWRLEDAYEDFKDLPTPREILPADNYPVKIQAGQVFAVEYLMSDGSTEWKYYISDGTVQNGQLITKRMKME